MKDILVRLHRDHKNSDSDGDTDSELVAGFSRSRAEAFACDKIALDDLTNAELNALQGAFQMRNSIDNNTLEAWKPWWESEEAKEARISSQGGYLVEPIQNSSSFDVKPGIPRLLDFPIADFSQLTSKPPADNLILYLIDMLFWYCLELRLSNGDYECADQELVQLLIYCSKSFNIGDQDILENNTRGLVTNIIESCCREGKKLNQNISRGLAVGIIKDVSNILGLGRTCIILALSDLFHIFSRIHSTYRYSSGPSKTRAYNFDRKRLSLMRKKLLYFLSWANEFAGGIASAFSQELEDTYRDIMESLRPTDEIRLP